MTDETKYKLKKLLDNLMVVILHADIHLESYGIDFDEVSDLREKL